jgi:hypothetical protein
MNTKQKGIPPPLPMLKNTGLIADSGLCEVFQPPSVCSQQEPDNVPNTRRSCVIHQNSLTTLRPPPQFFS